MLQSLPRLQKFRIQWLQEGHRDRIQRQEPRAPAYSDRLSQLEKDVAESRDGTVKEMLEKLRGLSDGIEEINKRIRVDNHENEITYFRRQVERGSAPLPPQNQQVGTDRFPILMYYGERNSLSRFLKKLYTWLYPPSWKTCKPTAVLLP